MSGQARRDFRAMGAACSVLVFAPQAAEGLCAVAATRVELLEQSWSRFRESSELNRLNARAGTGPVVVSSDLLSLVWHMKRAWELTDGLFDPTMLAQIKAAGYDADFATVIARDAIASARIWAAPYRSSAMAEVVVDLEPSTVQLPRDIGLDPGAIGKGLAGDIISTEMMSAGATGVLIDLGGDIVMAGRPGDEDSWAIAVEDERHPDDGREPRVVHFDPDEDASAIATSSTLYRRWAGGARHHVIDPRTGDVANPEIVQATVWCGAGWLAEVSATAALLMPKDQAVDWLQEHQRGFAVMTPDQSFSSLVGASRG
ncbi:MAG TPA: FAD:protein FMN transferase [Actinobacteria bacterium]|nr:FAD:protein FMN transferase [Actinomycetota bacterium]